MFFNIINKNYNISGRENSMQYFNQLNSLSYSDDDNSMHYFN